MVKSELNLKEKHIAWKRNGQMGKLISLILDTFVLIEDEEKEIGEINTTRNSGKN
jgi:hypothetical protein